LFFAQAEDVGAVGGEGFYAVARVEVRAFYGWLNGDEQVGVGPVVAFDQRPQGDDGAVDVFVVPDAGGVGGESVGDGAHFRRAGEAFGDGVEHGEPFGSGGGVDHAEVALDQTEGGELAFVGIGIEEDGTSMPLGKGVEVRGGIDPIAEALEVGRRVLGSGAVGFDFDGEGFECGAQERRGGAIEVSEANDVREELEELRFVQGLGFARVACVESAKAGRDSVHKDAPGLAALNVAGARVFFPGVFVDELRVDFGEPGLDEERGHEDVVLFEAAEFVGVVDGVHQGQDESLIVPNVALAVNVRLAPNVGLGAHVAQKVGVALIVSNQRNVGVGLTAAGRCLVVVSVFHSATIVARALGQGLSKWKPFLQKTFFTEGNEGNEGMWGKGGEPFGHNTGCGSLEPLRRVRREVACEVETSRYFGA
jgi:hypothetical protein